MPRVQIACGIHPHNAAKYSAELDKLLRDKIADDVRVVAVGEVGLDYHYDISPRKEQQDVFRRMIAIAHDTNKPLILHIREAHEDAFPIMEEEGWPEAGTLLHCYTDGPDTLRPWLERDCYVAFGGAVTFNNSDAIREAVPLVSHDRLLIETDAPFMSPVPLRGSKGEPAEVVFTADYLATLLGCNTDKERVAFFDQLCENTVRLLGK